MATKSKWWWNNASAIGNSVFTNLQQLIMFIGLGSMFITSYMIDLKSHDEMRKAAQAGQQVPKKKIQSSVQAGALIILFLNVASLHL